MNDPAPEGDPQLVLYGEFHLLDRQVTDTDGLLVCKIDDLELTDDHTPRAVAILAGPAALGPRFRHRLARWILAIHRRLAGPSYAGPPRVPIELVARISDEITLKVSRNTLGVAALEDWLRTHVVARIPGGGHAPE